MDLISREAVKEQAKASYHVAESMEQLGNLYEDCINALPSAFEGMTNEEVMKAVFGKSYADIDSYIYGSKDVEVKQWCRSPYKGVSE